MCGSTPSTTALYGRIRGRRRSREVHANHACRIRKKIPAAAIAWIQGICVQREALVVSGSVWIQRNIDKGIPALATGSQDRIDQPSIGRGNSPAIAEIRQLSGKSNIVLSAVHHF